MIVLTLELVSLRLITRYRIQTVPMMIVGRPFRITFFRTHTEAWRLLKRPYRLKRVFVYWG